MIQVGSLGDGSAGRIEAELPTGRAWSSDVLRAHDGDLTPHAFFVHQDPNVVLDRHYHDAAEFQVVVAGGGKLGTHPIRAYAIHYASHQAVYGPLTADERGLDFMTFRAVYQRGLFKFPDEKRRMERGRRSQLMGEVPPGDPRQLASPKVERAIEAADDGLAAWIVRLPPKSQLLAPLDPGGAGRFLMLVSGIAAAAGAALAPLDVAWIGNADATLDAGPDGAELIVLQMPSIAAPEIGPR